MEVFMIYEEIYFPELGDERGHLVVAETFKDIPFVIKRVFYIYGTESGVIRGQHANRNSEFVLINVKGSSKIRIDNGYEEATVLLDKPNKAVYINKMIWKDMYDFSEDSILVVLSSEGYDPKEYIRDYQEYIKIIKEGKSNEEY
jgi:dTDP-4-dehydrorhamnose 3,5-epimerase-like enzyme